MAYISPDDWVPVGVEGLEDAALKAVKQAKNTLVTAGPGAGKTELLAQKAHFLLTTRACPPPKRILAISFKRDAASNLGKRVQSRCPEYANRFDSRTLDSFAKLLLDRFYKTLPIEWQPIGDYEILFNEYRSREAEEWLLRHSVPRTDRMMSAPELTLAQLAHGYSIPFEDLDNYPVWKQLAAALWSERLTRTPMPVLTFPMINRLAAYLVRNSQDVSSLLRKTYSHVFLDEFQDTTSSQYELIKEVCNCESLSVIAVGDLKQRIMIWAGAMPNAFDVFKNDFGADEIGLIHNYRSAHELVEMQNNIAAAIDGKKDACISKCMTENGACTIIEFSSQEEEAAWISEYINNALTSETHKHRDFCIIVRQQTPRMISSLQESLNTKGIILRDEGLIQDLLAEPAIDLIILALNVIAKSRAPKEYIELRDELLSLWGYSYTNISNIFNDRVKNVVTIPSTISPTDVQGVISHILLNIGVDSIRSKHKQYVRGTYLEDIITSFTQDIQSKVDTGSGLSEALDSFLGKNTIPAMTIHKSKGLEFKTVIFLGLEDAEWWNFRRQQDEEKRSFFVAFSRAIQEVIFTYSDSRMSNRGRFQTSTKTETDALYQALASAGVPVLNKRGCILNA